MAGSNHKFSPPKPSNLRFVSGPLSPASSLTPPYSPRVSTTALESKPTLKNTYPPPPQPLQWLWSCHLCHQRYPLGATRRCLHDGHFFCSGVAVSKRTGAIKNKKRVACASEFDYVGWKAWAEWRQETQIRTPTTTVEKNCSNNCTYPSECRWGKRHGIESLTVKSKYVAFSPDPPPPAPSKTGKPRSSVFLDRLIKSAERKSARSKGLLSPVEEEEPQSSMSPSGVQARLPDLEFPTLSLESKNYEESPEDTLMSDSDSETDSDSDSGSGTTEGTLYTPPPSERPQFSPHSMQSEETTTVERIIEYASASAFTEPSPTSPGRRNAWDWSIDVPDGMVLSEDFLGEEQVVWEMERYFDVEMS